MAPRSRSSLKGSWECLRKPLSQRNQLEWPLRERLENEGGEGQPVSREAVTVTGLGDTASPCSARPQPGLRASGEKVGWGPLFPAPRVYGCPPVWGKQVLMRKFN